MNVRRKWASMIRRYVWIAYDELWRPKAEGSSRAEAIRNYEKQASK